uniref:Uncharacterized protein n=1 Tax=Timema cristinae TaxID=61476 RepID=A0A7R9H4I1_TIMCR|nr:unnamed protein product [Timema cristinae]
MRLRLESRGYGRNESWKHWSYTTATWGVFQDATSAADASRFLNEFKGRLSRFTPERDLNIDLPVIDSLVYYDSSSLDHAAIEVDSRKEVDREERSMNNRLSAFLEPELLQQGGCHFLAPSCTKFTYCDEFREAE